MRHVKEAVGYKSKVQADLDRRENLKAHNWVRSPWAQVGGDEVQGQPWGSSPEITRWPVGWEENQKCVLEAKEVFLGVGRAQQR